ncbi:hypothetical protein ACFX13_038705 [Malus domestica]
MALEVVLRKSERCNCIREGDMLAGLDATVEDGMDVLSLSLGGLSLPFYDDVIAIDAQHLWHYYRDALAPKVAHSSSRGPSIPSPGILKPDIIAPGVDILAAWPELMDNAIVPNPKATLNIISGTSMATPHLSGIAEGKILS